MLIDVRVYFSTVFHTQYRLLNVTTQALSVDELNFVVVIIWI